MTKFIRIQDSLESYSCSDSAPLSKWDRETIIKAGVDIAIYSYFEGSYEGSGTLICQKDNKWYYHSMSHCSCNGPVDDLYLTDGKDTLVELLENFSEELRSTVYVLVSSYEALDEEDPEPK
jgi:hypothetical protein